MFCDSDHIFTRLDLTDNPASLANGYTNFGAVATPIFIERPLHESVKSRTDAFSVETNRDQLNNLGGSLNGSRLALAMEMARLDVERMKFIEAPITITRADKNGGAVFSAERLTSSEIENARLADNDKNKASSSKKSQTQGIIKHK